VKSVVFVEQFYYPDGWGGAQIPRDITTTLVKCGWSVEVVCGSEPYAPVVGIAQTDPTTLGVRMRRIPRILRGDIHSHKLLRQLCFYALAVPLLLLRRPSVYVVQTNPPLIVPIVALISWLHRRPMVIIAQDIYPEVIFAYGSINSNSIAAWLLKSIFRSGYRRAAKVISLGPNMSRRLIEKGVDAVRIVNISNWATGDVEVVRGRNNKLRTEWGLQNKFVLLYSGNLGKAHDIESPIAALKDAVVHVPNLCLVFIGNGSRTQEAKALAVRYGVESLVHFRSPVSSEMLPHSLGLADVALVTLMESFEGLVVPSKLLGHLARGVPTLYIGPPGDIDYYLEESGGGCSVRNGETQAIVQLLLHWQKSTAALERMSESGKYFYQEKLSQSVGLEKYRQVIGDLVGQKANHLDERVRT
jgi:colanic acid biosynthesis glycosyl transferase WcaI